MPEPTRHVFVYGTLRRGEINDINRQSAAPSPVFVGEASLAGTLYDLGAYPGLVLGGAGRVQGEVYAISPALERRLDEIEEVLPEPTGEYDKREVDVVMQGQTVRCLVYEIARSRTAGRREISGGDWVRRA